MTSEHVACACSRALAEDHRYCGACGRSAGRRGWPSYQRAALTAASVWIAITFTPDLARAAFFGARAVIGYVRGGSFALPDRLAWDPDGLRARPPALPSGMTALELPTVAGGGGFAEAARSAGYPAIQDRYFEVDLDRDGAPEYLGCTADLSVASGRCLIFDPERPEGRNLAAVEVSAYDVSEGHVILFEYRGGRYLAVYGETAISYDHFGDRVDVIRFDGHGYTTQRVVDGI